MDETEVNGLIKKVATQIDEILRMGESEAAIAFVRIKVAELAMQSAVNEIAKVKPMVENALLHLPPEAWGHLSAASVILEGTLASLNEESNDEEG